MILLVRGGSAATQWVNRNAFHFLFSVRIKISSLSVVALEYSYTFTRFPLKNSEVLMKWENAIKKYGRQGNNWKATQYSRICGKHFLKTDFTSDANRWLKFNVIPSVFNGSQTAATRHPEQDLTSLVNTLLDGSTDLSSSQHPFAPVRDDAIISESVEPAVSNNHLETFPPDAATRHPEQDLTSLVNISTFKKLGCSFGYTYDTILTKFKHPVTGEDVFVILDACRMLKYTKNNQAWKRTTLAD